MAEVFAGQALGSEGFQKPVAIKRLLPELAGDESFVARLVAEAKLVVGMQHSNIVGVLDLVRDGDDVFVVMEYVDGPSLRQLMQARGGSGTGPLSLGLATHIVAAAGHGLEFAHAREAGAIVHADVSPSNLLLTLSGEVKVADFGIARRAGTGGAVEGKWAYMPPEQARGEPLDARADELALGVVQYELVTGVRPYAGRVKRSLPPETEPVVRRAISDGAKHRFSRVQELIDALVEVRFRHGWREGASELREAIRAARPRTAALTQARTQITGKPVTVMTSSLLVPDLSTAS